VPPARPEPADPGNESQPVYGATARIVVAALLVEAALVLAQVRAKLSAPFWYDEQWRAYHLSLTRGFWQELQHVNTAVAAGWVVVERASVLVLGNAEWAWRLPQAVAVPALGVLTWRVARHCLGLKVTASAIIAAAMIANGPILGYAVQLKPYSVEALCCVVALRLWLEASDPHRHHRRQILRRLGVYAGIGMCALVATPLVFVVAPLLVIDLARGLRHSRELAGRVGPTALAGVIALAHLIWFVLPQTRSANIHYWDADFLPRAGRPGFVFVGRQLATFVPDVVSNGLPLPEAVHAVLVSVLVVGLTAGTVLALADRRAWPLPVTLAGALASELAASALRLWPFGFVRVNLFLVPLFYLLAGFGIARLAAVAIGGAWGWARRGRPVVAARAAGVVALAAVLVATGAGCWGVARASAAVIARQHRLERNTAWGAGMRTLVGQARDEANPRDLAIVAGFMGVKGWSYYMLHYDGWPSDVWRHQPISPDRTLIADPPDQRSVRAFLRAHPGAERVLLLTMINARRGWEQAVVGPLESAGYRQTQTITAPITGTLTIEEKQHPTLR